MPRFRISFWERAARDKKGNPFHKIASREPTLLKCRNARRSHMYILKRRTAAQKQRKILPVGGDVSGPCKCRLTVSPGSTLGYAMKNNLDRSSRHWLSSRTLLLA